MHSKCLIFNMFMFPLFSLLLSDDSGIHTLGYDAHTCGYGALTLGYAVCQSSLQCSHTLWLGRGLHSSHLCSSLVMVLVNILCYATRDPTQQSYSDHVQCMCVAPGIQFRASHLAHGNIQHLTIPHTSKSHKKYGI